MFPLTQTPELSVYWRHDTAAIHISPTPGVHRGQRVPLAAWTGINFVVSWERAVNVWNQCESLHRIAHVLILQMKGWIPYILDLMYVDLNLKNNSNHYDDIVCIQSCSGLRSTSHIFPVNDHNDIDQNWDYISFLIYMYIYIYVYIYELRNYCKSMIQSIQTIWNTYFKLNYS